MSGGRRISRRFSPSEILRSGRGFSGRGRGRRQTVWQVKEMIKGGIDVLVLLPHDSAKAGRLWMQRMRRR